MTLYKFLAATFLGHGIAFTILGIRRRKNYYFFLTGTFTFLTALYALKSAVLNPNLPGTHLPLSLLLRICAILCTLTYLSTIYREPGSWLYRLTHRS